MADSIFQILPPIIFSAIVYRLVGLQHDAAKWFTYLAFMILTQFSATSLATMVSTLCRTTDLSTTILPITFEIGRLFGGFFLPPAQLPRYFVWLDALSYCKCTSSTTWRDSPLYESMRLAHTLYELKSERLAPLDRLTLTTCVRVCDCCFSPLQTPTPASACKSPTPCHPSCPPFSFFPAMRLTSPSCHLLVTKQE